MNQEINLLRNYPQPKRDLKKRLNTKTKKNRLIARKFGKEFFDGNRQNGYGGYYYNPRFWKPVIKDFVKFYSLNKNSKILDIGCGKGFMLHDFKDYLDCKIRGIDISKYAIKNCLHSVAPYLSVSNANKLPFKDKSFDLAISINTLHNLSMVSFKKSIAEIKRVAKNSFITLDAYNNENEKKRMDAWNLTAKIYYSTKEWKKIFKDINYTGDYNWFIP